MRKFIIFTIFIISNILFSQTKLDCFDTIFYKENNNDLSLLIKNKEFKFIEPVKLFAFKSCKITIFCKKDYLNLTYTFQNGNEYKIVNNIFKPKNGIFYLMNTFTTYTDRNQTSLTGLNYSNIKLDDFSIDSDLFDKKLIEKEISLVTGHQEEKEVEEIPYYNLILKSFKMRKFEDIKLFTNEFVIDELGIEENLNIVELNNVAFVAYKSRAYAESLYILNKVIKKNPKRIVAYLNIADNYWALNQKEKAVENYKKYIQLMKDQKKNLKKVPKYVYQRLQIN